MEKSQLIVIEIRGCHSPERFADVHAILGNQDTYQNTPYLYTDFLSRERAHLALVNLNQVPGIKARIVE